MDAARQPFLVDDTALSGHSALPGQSSHSAAVHGDTPREVEMGPAPPSSPALPDQLSISLPGISRLPGAQPSLSGVRPPPGFTGIPMGSGEFSGSGQMPAIRQAPPLHREVEMGPAPLAHRPCRTNWAFPFRVSLACLGPSPPSRELGHPRDSPAPPLLGRPISSLGIAQNNQVSAPLGQTQQQGTSEIPLDQALNRVFPGGIPAAMEQYLAPAWGFHWHSSIGPNGSTGSASRYRRSAKLGDDTALTGQSSQQWLASRGILSWKWRWSRPQPAPLSPPALPDQMGISLPGTSYLTGSDGSPSWELSHPRYPDYQVELSEQLRISLPH